MLTNEIMVHNPISDSIEPGNNGLSFIEANTLSISLDTIERENIIPVFSKDNEATISHVDFITTTQNTVESYFYGAKVFPANIRVSHPIKGRVPEARNKAAKDLLESEKTLYYERMAFTIEIPEIGREILGNRLNLVIGGVKSYSEDNLFNKKSSGESFKIFIGFQNKVCLNLCIWTDGLKEDIKVHSKGELAEHIYGLISSYNAIESLCRLEEFALSSISEQQFAQLIGRCKLYGYLPQAEKKQLPTFNFLDCHINAIAEDYYSNESFCREDNGRINLWRLYNLFTGANKNSYIDKLLSRQASASQFIQAMHTALKHNDKFWFID